MIKQLIDLNSLSTLARAGNQGISLQKFMEIVGPVVTCLLNATLVSSGYVFKKCKARQVTSNYKECLDIIVCFEFVKHIL